MMVHESLVLLVLRVFVGVAFIFHGYPKLSAQRKMTIDFMKSKGIPPALTVLAALLEFLGGIALVIGFLTQIAGALIALEMLATTLLSKAKLDKKYMLGYELDLSYLALGIALALLGGGSFSIDSFFGLGFSIAG